MADAVPDDSYWSRDASALAAALGSGVGGLTADRATEQLAAVGLNSVEDAPRLSALRLLLRQFESPLVLILAFAAAISLVLQQWVDAGIKVLERGRFPWPSAQGGTARLTSAQLGMLWEGIDWRRPDWGAPPARVG